MKIFGTSEGWFFGRILTCHILAFLIGMTLLWQPLGNVWHIVSAEVFYFVNGSLFWQHWWAVLWAALNTGTFDIVGAVLMFLPSVWYVFYGKEYAFEERLARASVAWAGVIVIVIISKQILPEIVFHSPSLTLEPAALLNEMVPSIEAKWESKNSFPGDHAVAAFAFVGLCFMLLDRRTAWISALFGFLYSVPRLFSGAHWLSDELVGGGIALFIALGWATNIPALTWSRAIWQRLLGLFNKAGKAS